MTKQQLISLLAKERIKLRKGIWLLPVLLCYAAGDTFLNLNTLEREFGAFGLWEGVVFKQPRFFDKYMLLVACSALIGFLQAWPESRGRRLRLLFHMPLEPVRIVSVMFATGFSLVLLLNLVAFSLLSATLQHFHFPAEITRPVLLTVLPWGILSIAAYFAAMAFFIGNSISVRLLIIAVICPLWGMLGETSAYGLYRYAFPGYGVVAALFVFMPFYSVLHYLDRPERGRVYSFVRFASLFLSTCGLGVLALSLYWRIFSPAEPHIAMHFSPVSGEFVMSGRWAGPGKDPNDGQRYWREDATSLDREAFRAALPFLYVRDLVKWDRYPATIGGVAVAPFDAERSWQFMRLFSEDWNAPPPMLHMLFESKPHGARLQKPADFFRLSSSGNGIEFLTPHDGKVDSLKSSSFTRALRAAGFVFPVMGLGGNPDVRKRYDAGYFIADSKGFLFQMQMVDGQPSCRRLKQQISGRIRYIAVSEHHREEFFGFVATDDALYAIMQKEGGLKRLPIGKFDADALSLAIWSDILYTSVFIERPGMPGSGIEGVAMNPDFSVVRRYGQAQDSAYAGSMRRLDAIASFLFPLQITTAAASSSYRHLQVVPGSDLKAVLAGSVFALVVFIRLARSGTGKRAWLWSDYLFVAAFGFVAVAVMFLSEADHQMRLMRNG